MKIITHIHFYVLAVSICFLSLIGCASDKNRSPIAQYNAEMRESIHDSWHVLAKTVDRNALKQGKIVVQMRQRYDGKVVSMKILESSMGAAEALLLERAILSETKYKPWPEDMFRLVGANYRMITATYYFK